MSNKKLNSVITTENRKKNYYYSSKLNRFVKLDNFYNGKISRRLTESNFKSKGLEL